MRVEVDRAAPEFWRNKRVEELACEQGVKACDDPADLAGDWPQEDSMDEFLQFLREVRR